MKWLRAAAVALARCPRGRRIALDPWFGRGWRGGVPTILLLAACARPPVAAEPAPPAPDEVRFGDRVIALSPHLTGFPYRNLVPLLEADRIVYDVIGEQRRLHVAPIVDGAAPDLATGAPLGEIDWSTRSRWELRHHPPTDALWFAGDERNDERINLFRLDLASGAVTAVTDEDYLYGWSFSPDDARVALVVRRGAGPYESCLETLAPDGGGRTRHLCDTPEVAFTWTEPSWAPDGRGVVVEVNLDGRRDRANLAWVPFDGPAVHLLLDEEPVRTGAGAVAEWLDRDRVVVIDDAPGMPRIGLAAVERGEIAWKVTLDRELGDLRLLRPEGRPMLVGVLRHPEGDHLATWDPETGAELARIPAGGEARILADDERARLVVETTSAATPFRAALVDVARDGRLVETPWLRVPEEVERRIVQCAVEAVRFPTHDLDPATGRPRELHGFLYTPRAPLDPPAVRVVGFYGGANRFDVDAQVYCEAGIATFSPAVRGSRGYGPEFARLNDRDLGGDEIADLFAAARMLVERGYDPERIGLWGRSHGGYATMRALTFPPGTNGHAEPFPFAFGMADAGFSDILTFHEACNIPDWVLLEAGDPATEREKLLDRSPLHHVDLLRAPLLLVHGEQDSRVPVGESRRMAEACAAAGKACTYLEVPGQGHVVRGLANEQRVWQARFSFLSTVLLR